MQRSRPLRSPGRSPARRRPPERPAPSAQWRRAQESAAHASASIVSIITSPKAAASGPRKASGISVQKNTTAAAPRLASRVAASSSGAVAPARSFALMRAIEGGDEGVRLVLRGDEAGIAAGGEPPLSKPEPKRRRRAEKPDRSARDAARSEGGGSGVDDVDEPEPCGRRDLACPEIGCVAGDGETARSRRLEPPHLRALRAEARGRRRPRPLSCPALSGLTRERREHGAGRGRRGLRGSVLRASPPRRAAPCRRARR